MPKISAPDLAYDNVFRLMIVQFMDAQNLDIRSLKKSCIHFAQPDGKMIPFESFNIFYRDDKQQKLAEIRQTLDTARFARRTVNAENSQVKNSQAKKSHTQKLTVTALTTD